ncbi:MAG: YraN family protein [Candidatus Cloacimonadota bacterium]|nr:MAG: YraN family protein [Candidatus Cloacimonadota bacterium]PIE79073.1 MAG: YraN family protein [Candidatus Delongbacteria bacterium]
MDSRALGNIGETKASKYLEAKGFIIVERNYHYSRFSEIDIIAKKGDTYVFVEVKSDFKGNFGDPLLWINNRKIRNISKAAFAYIHKKKINNYNFRFDVITITKVENDFKINHIENSFEPIL